MFRLQNNHHQAVYVRSTKGNHIPVVYVDLKIICGRHLWLTYKGIRLLHIQKQLQCKRYSIKLENKVK